MGKDLEIIVLGAIIGGGLFASVWIFVVEVIGPALPAFFNCGG